MKCKYRVLGTLSCSILMVTMLVIGVEAADFGIWSTPSWYTPQSATIGINSTHFNVSGMQWETNDFSSFHYWEGELRAPYAASEDDLVTQMDDVWGEVTSGVSNLPDYYYEGDDPNDKTFGSYGPDGIDTEEDNYYSRMSLQEKSTYNNGGEGWRLIFESEYGIWVGPLGDGLPSAGEAHPTELNTKTLQWLSYSY